MSRERSAEITRHLRAMVLGFEAPDIAKPDGKARADPGMGEDAK